nr:hypothetical protein [uncultured Mediterraneibacter sp.]
MNPGSYYLYEYESCCRRRNLGFLQISPHGYSYLLTLHVKNLPIIPGEQLEVHAFILENQTLTGSPVALLQCSGQNLSTQLVISGERFPHKRTLKHIDGFIIFSITQNRPQHWIASAVPLPDFYSFSDCSLSTEEALSSEPEDSSLSEAAVITEEIASETVSEAALSDASIDDTSIDAASTEEAPTEEAPTEETAIQDASIQARKITHAEISTLPRRFWPLANNSFLLHGCHNYHHLLLIKEEDHLWLGVPGLYDPREAHMANLFGFPQFTSSYISILELTEDECENSESFGHWCRYLM